MLGGMTYSCHSDRVYDTIYEKKVLELNKWSLVYQTFFKR